MLPGGMCVLGIFVVGPGDVFGDNKAVSKIRTVIHHTTKKLATNNFFHGNSQNSEKLALHLSSTTKRYKLILFITKFLDFICIFKPSRHTINDIFMKLYQFSNYENNII